MTGVPGMPEATLRGASPRVARAGQNSGGRRGGDICGCCRRADGVDLPPEEICDTRGWAGGPNRQQAMNWVGTGNGEFRAITTYQYVGQGCGDFREEAPPTPRTSNAPGGLCLFVVGILGMIFFVAAVISLFSAGSSFTTPRYDCTSENEAWTMAQSMWCCAREGKGCSAQQPAPRAARAMGPGSEQPPRWDCDFDHEDWETGWSLAKKQWCCQITGRGCVQ